MFWSHISWLILDHRGTLDLMIRSEFEAELKAVQISEDFQHLCKWYTVSIYAVSVGDSNNHPYGVSLVIYKVPTGKTLQRDHMAGLGTHMALLWSHSDWSHAALSWLPARRLKRLLGNSLSTLCETPKVWLHFGTLGIFAKYCIANWLKFHRADEKGWSNVYQLSADECSRRKEP